MTTELTDDQDRAENRRVLSLSEDAGEHEAEIVGVLRRERDYIGGWREDEEINPPVTWVLELEPAFLEQLQGPVQRMHGSWDDLMEVAEEVAGRWLRRARRRLGSDH